MPQTGRKPKPARLRLIEGNPGKRKVPREVWAPASSRAVPEPPAYLDEVAKGEWWRVAPDLTNLGILHPTVDIAVLAAYCTAYSRWRGAEKIIAKLAADGSQSAGLLYKTPGGALIHNPAVSIANKAMRDMVNYMSELGMTPVARARIGAESEGGGVSKLESLMG